MAGLRSLSWLVAAMLVSVLGFAGAAQAVPIQTFTLNQSALDLGPLGSAGTVQLLQMNMDEVQVTVSIAPNLLINTGGADGGTHTPFAFNLSDSIAAIVNSGQGITVISPVTDTACAPTTAPCFTPAYAPGNATPYGTLNEALNYSGPKGGGTAHGNPGPLVFTVTGAGVGNVTPDGVFSAFVADDEKAIFAADLWIASSNSTGTVAAFAGTPGNTGTGGGGSNANVPEPATTLLFGSATLLLLLLARRSRRA
jgi:hypothetical protein